MEHKVRSPGENGTEIDTCVGCLLDALAKLDSGAVLVNVTVDLTDNRPAITPPPPKSITLPLVIDVDVALLLQQQLAIVQDYMKMQPYLRYAQPLMKKVFPLKCNNRS